MSTVRIAKRRRYTQIDRRAVRDFGLSLRAIGLLVWLLDKPDDWRIDSTAISRDVKEGREAVRTALRELEVAGFVIRTKFRDQGRWATETVVYEHPDLADTSAQEPVAVAPPTGAQETDAGSADAGNPGAKEETGDGTTEKEEPSSADAPEATLQLVGGSPPEQTTGQRASAILAGYLDWCDRQKRPKPARSGQAAQAIRMVLDAGWSDRQVKDALTAVPTVTTNALEVALSRANAKPAGQRAAVDVAWDRSRPSGVVEL